MPPTRWAASCVPTGWMCWTFPRNDSPSLRESVARWLARCARLPKQSVDALIRPQDTLVRRAGTDRSVRSLQRFTLPRGWDAERVALAYSTWLGAAIPWVLRTEVDGDGSFRRAVEVLSHSLLKLDAGAAAERGSSPCVSRSGWLARRESRCPGWVVGVPGAARRTRGHCRRG